MRDLETDIARLSPEKSARAGKGEEEEKIFATRVADDDPERDLSNLVQQ